MSRNLITKFAVAVVIALAMTITSTYGGDKPVPAQVGIISAGGALYNGGNIHYSFPLQTITNGQLVVTGYIKAGKTKVTFTDLTASPAIGSSLITGPTLSIPAGVQGDIIMKVIVKFNKKTITKRSVLVTVTAPPPVASSVSTSLLDVGFENSVTLDGSLVPTDYMGPNRTYTWTQTGGMAATLSTNGTVTTSFTTGALTNFVNMGTSLYVNDIDDAGYTNALYITPEHRFGSLGGISIDNEQATAATYTFRVVVSDGSIMRTGVFTVACTVQTPAQPNIPVGVTSYYKGATNSTDWVLISKPDGSVATLQHASGLIPAFRPDVVGVYVLKDNVSGKTLTNTAAAFTGVQFCAICHGPNNNVGQEDIVTEWSKTGHASMAQRGVDGILSSHYSESCFQCHTVGYNAAPSAAANGNFKAVANELGWAFPTVLQPGNYDAMPDQLKNVANIQCENCHGPGSLHPGAPSLTLDVKVCGACHQDGSHHVRPEQWENSPHSGAFESIANSRGTRHDCARCHSPLGFTAVAKGEANLSDTNSIPTSGGPLTCQTCHDPHDTFDNDARYQLRVYDSALFGNPYFRTNNVVIGLGETISSLDPRLASSNLIITNTGASATCMTCHNGRQLPTQVQAYGSNAGKMFYQTGGPHDQLAGEVFAGVGAYDYGINMGNSFHTYLAECTTCHMYQGNTAGNHLGDHTFSMAYMDGTNEVQNVAACNQCHTEPVTDFDFKAVNAQDYDGNGSIDGVQTETQGLIDRVGYLLKTTGVGITTNADGHVTSVSSSGYSTNSVTLAEAQRKAAWNTLVEIREGSFGVHNTQYSVRLLQTTYTDLSTNWTGSVTNTFKNTFPNAYLR
jgi:hypothetical protein